MKEYRTYEQIMRGQKRVIIILVIIFLTSLSRLVSNCNKVNNIELIKEKMKRLYQINKEEAKELFNYKDGCLYWKEQNFANSRNMDKSVGYSNGEPYLKFSYMYNIYRVHVTIWNYHYGEIEDDQMIYHIDQDKLNNRIENLEVISLKENRRRCRVNNG